MNRIQLLGGLTFGLVASIAGADEIFVASPTTLILEGNPYSGSFTTIGACGGQAHSMTLNGSQLLIGDPNGRIYRRSAAESFVSYAYDVPNDAQALAMHAGNLLSAGSDGTVVRVDAVTGAVIATLTAPGPASALLVVGDTLYVGSSLGVVFKGGAQTGGFGFWGTCGGPVNSMTIDSTHLILGSSNGQVYRINLTTQAVDATFAVASDAAAMVQHMGDLLIGGSNSSLLRVERFTGAVKSAIGSPVPVGALAVQDAPEPGSPYCYGNGCPCGNDDGGAGCSNTTGFGARTAASGTTSVAADDLDVRAFQLPANKTSRFYMGQSVSQSPLGDGFLCTGGGGYPLFRFPVVSSGPSGSIAMPENLVDWCEQNLPPTGHLTPGSTWNFQAWYRDPAGPCGSQFNTTNSYSLTFAP